MRSWPFGVLPNAFVTSTAFGGRPGAATLAVGVGGVGSEVARGDFAACPK